MNGRKADILVADDVAEEPSAKVRVEWSRHDKVTVKFTTRLILGSVEHVSHELIDRRLLKRMKPLSGSVEARCKQIADQKAAAVHEALRLRLAALVQARHVQPEETN